MIEQQAGSSTNPNPSTLSSIHSEALTTQSHSHHRSLKRRRSTTSSVLRMLLERDRCEDLERLLSSPSRLLDDLPD